MRRQPTTGGDNRSGSQSQFFNNPPFQVPENGFAVLLEDGTDGLASARFDDVICIQECKMERVRYRAAHTGFSGTHKPDQGEIANSACDAHMMVIPDFGGIEKEQTGTPCRNGAVEDGLLSHSGFRLRRLDLGARSLFAARCLRAGTGKTCRLALRHAFGRIAPS